MIVSMNCFVATFYPARRTSGPLRRRSSGLGSGPRGEVPDYTGMDVIIVRDGKIVALYLFLDSLPS